MSNGILEPLPLPLPSPADHQHTPDTVDSYEEIIDRMLLVAGTNRAANFWGRQDVHGAPFPWMKEELRVATVEAMLRHDLWLGSRALVDDKGEPITDRVAFDLDCKDPDQLDARDSRYWAIRRLMGEERVPLVYATPSGLGLRVVYRIPTMPLKAIVTGQRLGLVADVLRGAEMPIVRGEVEIFPQAAKLDRVMLGRRMPILDPGTLQPIGEPAIGDVFSHDALLWALRYVERWYDRPEVGLLDHLSEQPRCPLVTVREQSEMEPTPDTNADDPESTTLVFVRRDAGHITVSESLDRLVRAGLTRPSSRSESEFLVGIVLALLGPNYEGLDVPRHPTEAELARGIARWLARRNNTHSKEWSGSVIGRTTEQAIEWWVAERYLKRDARTGKHMIDRIIRAAQRIDPGARPVVQLTDDDRRKLHDLAAKHLPAGAGRYHFEIWANRWMRAVKEIRAFHDGRGRPVKSFFSDAGVHLLVEIASEWMEDWPFGKGRSHKGTGYIPYRRILADAGLMLWMHPYVSPTHRTRRSQRAQEPRATMYRVPEPTGIVTVAELRYAPWDLSRTLREIARIDGMEGPRGRSWTLDEAYHALWVVRERLPLTDLYGRGKRELIEALSSRIEARSASTQLTGDPHPRPLEERRIAA